MGRFGLEYGVIYAAEPPRVTVERLGAGAEVWLARDIKADVIETGGSGGETRAVDCWTATVVHYVTDGVPDAADVDADFDNLWAAHAHDGETAEEGVAALRAYCADLESALLEIGDMIGSE